MANKNIGNINIVFLTCVSGIIIVILFAFCIMYVQITSTIINIKNDLYSISQNGIVANDEEGLALNIYTAESNQLKNYIGNVLNKNYIKTGSSIKSINIEECTYIIKKEEVSKHTNGRYIDPIIHIKIKASFSPIIKINNISKTITIIIHEDVKATLMKYKGG